MRAPHRQSGLLVVAVSDALFEIRDKLLGTFFIAHLLVAKEQRVTVWTPASWLRSDVLLVLAMFRRNELVSGGVDDLPVWCDHPPVRQAPVDRTGVMTTHSPQFWKCRCHTLRDRFALAARLCRPIVGDPLRVS